MMMAAGWILMAMALCGALYVIVSLRALQKLAHETPASASHFPAVTLLKPLRGAESGLRENLESFCAQDYPGAVQIVFGVQDEADPAIAVVEDLKARTPRFDIALAVGAREDGSNPKIANLIGMFPHAKHDVLVLSDSDIGVAPDYLRKIVGALEEPGIGAVTCYYRGRARGNVWSRLAAMGIDRFLPNVVCAVSFRLAAPCFGSTIALKRSLLADIGGFEKFRNDLADDYEIGRSVRGAGLKLAYPPMVLSHSCNEQNFRELFRHELRWSRTIRGIDPLGHAGSLVTYILPLGLVAALLLGGSGPALVALGAIVAVRIYEERRIDRFLGRTGSSIWLFPLRDMLFFAVFVGSFFVKQVDWRGSRYRLSGSGELARE